MYVNNLIPKIDNDFYLYLTIEISTTIYGRTIKVGNQFDQMRSDLKWYV